MGVADGHLVGVCHRLVLLEGQRHLASLLARPLGSLARRGDGRGGSSADGELCGADVYLRRTVVQMHDGLHRPGRADLARRVRLNGIHLVGNVKAQGDMGVPARHLVW